MEMASNLNFLCNSWRLFSGSTILEIVANSLDVCFVVLSTWREFVSVDYSSTLSGFQRNIYNRRYSAI